MTLPQRYQFLRSGLLKGIPYEAMIQKQVQKQGYCSSSQLVALAVHSNEEK